MAEPTNTDLALQISELKGQVQALVQTTTLQIQGVSVSLQDSITDRRDLHREIDSLKVWRARLGGLASAASLLALYAALHQAGLIH